MAWLEIHQFSPTLGMQTTVHVLLPSPDVIARVAEPLPTLYLLHGMSDDQSIWLRQTRIEAYAARYRMAVVMPMAGLSFYNDMAYGGRYFTYIGQELPDALEAYLPLSKKREDRFVAGLSMGGYGSLLLALRRPDRYAAAASLSGAVMLHKQAEAREADESDPFYQVMVNIFGTREALLEGPGNLCNLADALVKRPADAPRLYMACGDRDFLFADNNEFYQRYGKALSIEYHVSPGEHSWGFWNRYIERVLAWLKLPKVDPAWNGVNDDLGADE